MRRREFISIACGAVAGLPLAARAQQQARPVLGFLRLSTASRTQHLLDAFHRGLGELGFVDGQNVAIEYRWADSPDQLPTLSADLVRRQVAVIVANYVVRSHYLSNSVLDKLAQTLITR